VINSQDDAWYIRDLGSTNKTYINQLQVVTPVQIEDGDVITVGQVELRLHINTGAT
jgi:pSer/pThr/pTyr-binding forkhead associated (FHA) protein